MSTLVDNKTRSILATSIASVVLRVFVALVGLCAIRLTRSCLAEDQFVIYGLAMFAVGLNTAVIFPVNRFFWANYSASVFRQSLASVTTLTVICLPIILVCLLLFYGTNIWSWENKLSALIAACVIFAVSQQKTRFLYGSCVMTGKPLLGQLYLMFFSGLECLGAFWCQFTSNPFFWRLAGGSIICLILLRVSEEVFSEKSAQKTIQRYQIVDVVKTASSTVLSKIGLESMFASALFTFASMGERMVVPVSFPSGKDIYGFNTADYMLVAMYATAYLSILNVVVDLSRPHIFKNGEWQPNALKAANSMTCFSIGCGLIVISIGWWFGLKVNVVPESVDYLYWCSLICRMTTFCVLNVLHVDLWMSGDIKRVMPPWFLIVALTFFPLFTDTFLSGVFASWVVTIAISIVVFIQYFKFIKRYLKSRNSQIGACGLEVKGIC